jgi:small subunit ribosomal protein S8
MLTRIRNAISAKKSEVVLPYSKFKHSLAKLILTEGWINSVSVKEEARVRYLVVGLRYDERGLPAITGLRRVSKPGQRIYAGKGEVPKALGGIGVTIVSTSRGLMTDKNARQAKVGGEIICQIW